MRASRKEDRAACATPTADSGKPASCATLRPWLSRFTPGFSRCEYVKYPSYVGVSLCAACATCKRTSVSSTSV